MVTPPAALGMEAAGTVVDVGTGVHHLLPGDAVAYAHDVPGAYATLRTLPADRVVPVPADIDAETAAGALFKGMTVEYLLHRAHQLRAGDRVLVHAAAGGVGLLLCQWAKYLGATGIGTGGSAHKARVRRGFRCGAGGGPRADPVAPAGEGAAWGRGAG